MTHQLLVTIDRNKSTAEIAAEITRQTGYTNILARIAAAEIKTKGYYTATIDGIKTLITTTH